MLPQRFAVPDIITGYPLGDYLSVVMPEEITNLVSNPSFELATTGYTGVNANISRTSIWQRRGAWGLSVLPTNIGPAVYFGPISLTSGLWYTFSADFQGDAGKIYYLWFGTTGGASLASNKFIATGFKQRVWVNYFETSSTTRRLVLSRDQAYTDVSVFYTDGWQCEQKDHPTTYCDGDLRGSIVGRTDYLWNGTPHASTSWRSGQTGTGGKTVNLKDLGFTLMAILGLGMAPVNNIALPSSYGGGFYQNTIPAERQFSLLGSIQAYPFSDLQRKRRDLINAFKPERSYPKQPLTLQYQALDDSNNPTSEVLNIPCLFQDGLKGQIDNNNQERLGLQFQMFLPLIQGEGQEGANLGYQASVANVNHILERTRNGVWSALNSGTDGNVYALARGADGSIYVAGAFTHAGGGVANYIAKWDPVALAWSTFGTGMNGIVWALAVGPGGELYAGGDFTLAGGVANTVHIAEWTGGSWIPLGTGMNDSVVSLLVGGDGKLYAGGAFTTAGGVATGHVAMWDGAWNALTDRPNGIVDAMTLGPDGSIYMGGTFTTAGGVTVNNITRYYNGVFTALGSGTNNNVNALAVGPNGVLYAGGYFTTAGGIATSYIAQWNGIAWSPLGSGVNQAVYGLAIGSDGLLYVSGYFTVAGGLTLPESLAIWNQSSWVYIDMVESGAHNYNYAVLVDAGNNLYVGFFTTGTGTASTTSQIVNNGSAEVRPKIILTGAGTVYQLKSITTGKTIFFNLILLSGETAILDLENDTFISSFRGDIRSTILPGSAEDFVLQPGTNILSLFIGGTVDGNTAAVTYWTDQYEGIDEAVR